MSKNLGFAKPTFYFERPGPVNTRKTLELARDRAKELRIKLVVSSQIGGTIRTAVEVCKGSGVEIIGVTRPIGRVHTVSQIESFATFEEIPELKTILDKWRSSGEQNVINHMSEEVERELIAEGVKIVRGDNPIRSEYSQPLTLNLSLTQNIEIKNVDDVILHSLGLFSTPLGTVIKVAMLAVEAGAIPADKEVVSVGGTEKGVDYAIVAKPSTAAKMFDEREGFEVREIICKPRSLTGKSGYMLQRRIG